MFQCFTLINHHGVGGKTILHLIRMHVGKVIRSKVDQLTHNYSLYRQLSKTNDVGQFASVALYTWVEHGVDHENPVHLSQIPHVTVVIK